MAFDALFVRAITKEMSENATGGRVEKIFQPTSASLIFVIRCEGKNGEKPQSRKLLIDAGTSSPRIAFTKSELENPKVPPMFCMLLRKHLSSAKIKDISQLGFERVIKITFESRDELGYLSDKYIYAELMGKFSNLIFCDSENRVVSAFHLTDLSGQSKRALVSGMKYELPPAQEGKTSPLDDTDDALKEILEQSELAPAKILQNRYFGVSPLLCREISHRSGGETSKIIKELNNFKSILEKGEFVPTLLINADGSPLEYYFTPIYQYGNGIKSEVKESLSELIECFFAQRSKNDRLKQRASDILRLLTNAEARLNKRIILQSSELEECNDRERLKRLGDLITANIYALKKGMTQVTLTDYYDENCPSITISLDSRLTPAQNAQRYYKKYAKLKSAEIHLKEQIENGKNELKYLDTVFDSLTRAENEADLNEIRRELYESGYASRMKNYSVGKQSAPKPLEFKTSGGWRVLCGKNNAQNDYITHKIASKGDIWFHVKDYPGSHVVLLCDGDEPNAEDYNEAAILTAYYSKAPKGQKVTVDYTRVKNIKKPPASKPGYVTFSSNYSAYVTADENVVNEMKKRTKEK